MRADRWVVIFLFLLCEGMMAEVNLGVSIAASKHVRASSKHAIAPRDRKARRMALKEATVSGVRKLEEEKDGSLSGMALILWLIALILFIGGVIALLYYSSKQDSAFDGLKDIFDHSGGSYPADYQTFYNQFSSYKAAYDTAYVNYQACKRACVSNCGFLCAEKASIADSAKRTRDEHAWSYSGPWRPESNDEKAYSDLRERGQSDQSRLGKAQSIIALAVVLFVVGEILLCIDGDTTMCIFYFIGPSHGCFDGEQKVHVVDGATLASALQPVRSVAIGDYVLAAENVNEVPKPSRVFFAACSPATSQPIVVIRVAGHAVELTADHLIPLVDGATGRTVMTPAGEIREGNLVVTWFQDAPDTSVGVVEAVGISAGSGVVCDIKTERGVVIADGVVASVAATHHTLSKIGWTPIRAVSRVAPEWVVENAAMLNQCSQFVHMIYSRLQSHGGGKGLLMTKPLFRALHSEL